MSTVFRLKRTIEDEPKDALMIANKRLKLVDSDNDSAIKFSRIVRFVGTIKDSEKEDTLSLARTLRKNDIQSTYKTHNFDVRDYKRQQMEESSKENRYKVLRCLRFPDISNVEESEDQTTRIIDVEESKIKENATVEENVGCVYDLYYTQDKNVALLDDDALIDNVSIYSLDDNIFVPEECTENISYKDPYEWDSNSESNWESYPDRLADSDSNSDNDNPENDDKSDTKDDIDGSDDSNDHPYAYCIDKQDVELHGRVFAAYKKKALKNLGEYSSSSSDDEEMPEVESSYDW